MRWKKQAKNLSCSKQDSADMCWRVAWLKQARKVVLGATCFALIVLSGLFPAAQAAQGDLDLTFGSNGKVTTDFGGTTDYGNVVVLQPDGKIIVAGHAITNFPNTGFFSDFTLARYNPNGTLDTTFGFNGKVTTHFNGGPYDAVDDIALQPDGKIVAAGHAVNDAGSSVDIAVVRYNSDGSLDTTFGNNGKVTTHLNGSSNSANGVALQPDGKIVIAGSCGEYSLADIALARYNPDGSLDNSFGSSGKTTTHFNGGYNVSVSAADLVLQPDGKLVAVGYYIRDNNANAVFALARYNPDGTLDNSFGSGGEVITDIAGYASAVALQPDGRIIAIGHIRVGYRDNDVEMARFNSDGNLDTGFGNSGIVKTTFSSSSDDIGHAVTLQKDGKIVVAGHTGSYPLFDFALFRYTRDGQLDSSFGSNGKVSTDFNGNWEQAYGVAIQPDGKIVLAGECECPSGLDFAVARYTGEAAPTAGPATIDGRINTPDGSPLAGVVMLLSGTQSRKTITDSNGSYRFGSLETSGFYTVTPSRANYDFSPSSRSFSQLGDHTDAAFTASATAETQSPLDTSEYFVRQQYLDFLDREPDNEGFNYWSDQLAQCGVEIACINSRRIDVSAAFFMETEFQQTGSF
ncbi:MAG: carboxypeptidase regulatory-like domain-containing protein, partial [Pyrinomonadaceae bacterium]